MQNDVLYNKIMDNVLIITVEWALTDPDDPLSGAFSFVGANMKPSKFLSLDKPIFAEFVIVDDNGVEKGVMFASSCYKSDDGTSVLVYSQDLGGITGDLATDTWAIAE